MGLLDKLKTRLFLLAGRAILTAVNNSGKYQKLQVKALNGETITDMDHFQPMGIEVFPTPDPNTEVLVISPNGNRDNAVAVAIHNREDRPKDLVVGETRIYCKTFLTLQSGDATAWMPSIIANCPATGAPHGGPTAGIVKLRGK